MKTLLTLGLLLSFNAFAASHLALSVTSDRDTSLNTLTIITNEDGELEKLKAAKVVDGVEVQSTLFTVDQTRKSGAILFKSGEHEVIRLTLGDRFEPIYGGPVKLDYLVNGITGNRRFVQLEAVREGDTWAIKKAGKVVKNARIKTAKVFGAVVGVDQISF